ncbi:MAG: 1-phosphofructokinase [Atopobiaceae bacterium]|nr:1-phosphofructokinase [Atopobiaceae bacterium]
MILTITLNTSIDKAYRLDGLLVRGSVMRVASCSDSAGGKGLNVSRSIKTCGEEVLATGFVGGNNGQLLCELLDSDGIPHEFVVVENETRCCINVLEPDGCSTEFLEAGREIHEDSLAQLEARVSALLPLVDVVTISGSIPPGLPATSYVRLISLAHAEGKPCILDTSGTALMDSLEALPTVIKPNADEISQILGKTTGTYDELLQAARELHTTGIAQVVISLGGKGALMACDEGIFHGTAPNIDVVNPVGAGDTMVGALAVGISRKLSAPEQLRFAMACATANCLSAYTGRFEKEVANRLLEQTTVEQVF